MIVLFLLPIQLYDILVKLELFNGIICIFIVDFLFLAPFRKFFPFCDLYQTLEPRNYLRIPWYVLFLLSIHFYDILVKLELFIGIICTYCRFYVFEHPLASCFPFCDLYETIVPRNYIRNPWFVLFLLPIHFYDIFVKSELFNGIICTFIVDFVFFTTPFMSLYFLPFCDFYQTLVPQN